MDNIIRKIQELYPVSDDSLHLLKYCFKQQTFPAKTIIIQAGRFDNQVYFIEKGITRSYILHNGKEITTWFSMEGDVANLPEIVRLAKQYNAAVMVDEAHGIGVFGRDGRGTCDHFGVTDDVDLIMGTFSKSFASLGGFIATDKVTANYLRHNSRSYIFSASITPASTAAVGAALDIMESEPERIANLWDVTNYALEGFRRIGCEIGNTCTPIIPLFIRDNEKTFRVTRDLFDEGIFVNPVVSPAVAPKDTLIRFSLMATHTRAQVDVALEKIEKCFKHLDIIK